MKAKWKERTSQNLPAIIFLMTDLHVYLAVLKASYDYDPQSDDELPIKENQILLLLDKVDDEYVLSFLPSSQLTSVCSWWKVKIKSDVSDDEGPSGLVPAAYVEPVSTTASFMFISQ